LALDPVVVIALKLRGSVFNQSLNAALQQIGLRGRNVSLPSNAALQQFGSEKSISYLSNLPLNTALQQRYLPI
jgi:hypothetical protein